MKKNNRIFIYCLIYIIIGLSACKSKQEITDYTSLEKKYSEYEFKNCKDMIKFVNQFLDIYVDIIDRAYEQDNHALNEYVLINQLFAKHSMEYMDFNEECPEDFSKLDNEIDTKLESRIEKLNLIQEMLSSLEISENQDVYERFGGMDENYLNQEDWHPNVYIFVMKYNGAQFESCEEMISFREEYTELLIEYVNYAENGDDSSKQAIINLTSEIYPFLMQFEKQYDQLYLICPELMDKHKKEFESTLEPVSDRIFNIFSQTSE
jgi:hypothetical protein